MRRLLFVLLISGYAFGTCGTITQHKSSSSCSGTTCAVTVTSTGSGHILVYAWMGQSTSSVTISSLNNGGTWVHCTNCHTTDGDNDQTDMSYVLSSSSGVTSITATLSGSPTSISFGEVFELSCTGTAQLDTSGSGVNNTACTSCTGEALTLTGTSDVIAQIIVPSGAASAVTSPYSTNVDFPGSGDVGAAVAASQSSGAAPTWTTTSSKSAVAAIAFNDLGSGTHPNMPPVVY